MADRAQGIFNSPDCRYLEIEAIVGVGERERAVFIAGAAIIHPGISVEILCMDPDTLLWMDDGHAVAIVPWDRVTLIHVFSDEEALQAHLKEMRDAQHENDKESSNGPSEVA